MNNWNFTGNLGRDAEKRYTAGGEAAVGFSVGVKSGWGDKATTTWANCTIWGKRGEAVAEFLKKGTLVGVSGEVRLREYQDKEGQTRTNLEVRVDNLTLLGGKPSGDRQAESAPSRQQQSEPAKKGSFDDLGSDLPF